MGKKRGRQDAEPPQQQPPAEAEPKGKKAKRLTQLAEMTDAELRERQEYFAEELRKARAAQDSLRGLWKSKGRELAHAKQTVARFEGLYNDVLNELGRRRQQDVSSQFSSASAASAAAATAAMAASVASVASQFQPRFRPFGF
mmetsp:Transcript_86993/g.153552  ORF Transcript_86993/g.153552 Transcript_86993/m.153552 type:complete len:143 (+) Transcript_86993:63-491(+)